MRTDVETVDSPGVAASPDPQTTPPPAGPAGVTILVPAYDEEEGVRGVVERLHAIELGRPTEVLIVDDGSTDRTPELLAELGQEFARLRVIRREVNQGYGAALKIGFAAATHDIVVITDADGTYPEDRIADLVARIDDGAEMAVGARRGEDVHIPLVRRPAKAALRLLASYLAESRIPDLNSGLRAFRRDLVLKYRPILPQGFSFTTTITLASLTNHHRVDYVSVNYAHRAGSSKIRPIRDTLGFLALIVRTVMYFNPLKVFYPVTLLLTVALAVSLYVDIGIEPRDLGDKSVLLFVAVVQVLTMGLLADLIEKRSRL